MYYFQCDYAEGCHSKILEKLSSINYEQNTGYGIDPYCESARAKIKKECSREDIDVHFLVGGTQTNTTVIAACLRPWQGAVAADTGHIACHESGAIEASGHKVITLPSEDGKINAFQIKELCEEHIHDGSREHTVQPGMVYISFPTESGTLYTKKELTDIYSVCREYGLLLFVDGARLGYGLMSPANDLEMKDIARLCDVFYIGGTKCGALFGEAVIITNDSIKKDFRYIIKQRGGMLAKGWLLGVQFDELFTDGLYYKICASAVESAMLIRKAFTDKGIEMFGSSMTNQQFPILNDQQLAYFSENFKYEIWKKISDDKTAVRFCTSWATGREQTMSLVNAIQNM